MDSHVMVDVETLGTVPGCVIFAIGAVRYTEDAGGNGQFDEFITTVNPRSCFMKGLFAQTETVEWWKQQSDEARQLLTLAGLNGEELLNAMKTFAAWLRPDDLIWGNGADFDNAVLAAAFKACGMPVPWRKTSRCYRTLKSFFPEIKIVDQGVKHHPLDDARSQMHHLLQLLERLDDCKDSYTQNHELQDI